MMFNRRFATSIALAATITGISAGLPSANLLAQTAAPTAPAADQTCTLAASDCTLLAEATANVAQESTFTDTVDFALTLNDKTPLMLTAKGSGPFAVDSTNAPTGFRAALDLTTTDSRQPAGGSASLVVANGNLYYKTTADWKGISLSGQASPAAGATAAATANATESATAIAIPGSGSTVVAQATSVNLSADLATLIAQPGVVTLARNPTDATLDNQAMAQFVYTVDIAKLLQSPGSAPAITDLLKAALTRGGRATAADRLNARGVRAALALISRGVGKTTMTLTRWVGLTDHDFHAIDVEMNINARFNPLPTAKPITGTLHLLVTLSAIGQPVTITAPSGVTVTDPGSFGSDLLNGSGLLSGPLGSLVNR